MRWEQKHANIIYVVYYQSVKALIFYGDLGEQEAREFYGRGILNKTKDCLLHGMCINILTHFSFNRNLTENIAYLVMLANEFCNNYKQFQNAIEALQMYENLISRPEISKKKLLQIENLTFSVAAAFERLSYPGLPRYTPAADLHRDYPLALAVLNFHLSLCRFMSTICSFRKYICMYEAGRKAKEALCPVYAN